MKKLFVFCSVVGLAVLLARPVAAQVWGPQAEHQLLPVDVSHFALVDNASAVPERLVLKVETPAAVAPAAAVGLWPNPAHGTVHVELSEAAPAPVQLRLHDALGRVVWAQPVAAGTTVVRVPVADLPPGVYTVRLGTATARLAVE